MLELIQVTNDPAFARRCDALPGFRLWVDLERLGKQQRQAGRNTFISEHQVDDVAKVRGALTHARLMVRVNPLHAGTPAEVDAVIAAGAQLLMLPMFSRAAQVREFCAIVAGRVPVTPLLETAGALHSVAEWAGLPGVAEVYVGLNDLHLSLGHRFMFQALGEGLLEPVAALCRERGLRFGFGGIARLEEGLLPGRDVLAEHLRLGSQAVILSRTFHRSDSPVAFEDEVARLRQAERELSARSAGEVEADRLRIQGRIAAIAAGAA